MRKQIERADVTTPPLERKQNGELFRLTPAQRRRIQALLKECANFQTGCA